MELTALANLINTYAQRMHHGPALNEFEFCLYQQICRYVETMSRACADNLDERFPKKEMT